MERGGAGLYCAVSDFERCGCPMVLGAGTHFPHSLGYSARSSRDDCLLGAGRCGRRLRAGVFQGAWLSASKASHAAAMDAVLPIGCSWSDGGRDWLLWPAAGDGAWL